MARSRNFLKEKVFSRVRVKIEGTEYFTRGSEWNGSFASKGLARSPAKSHIPNRRENYFNTPSHQIDSTTSFGVNNRNYGFVFPSPPPSTSEDLVSLSQQVRSRKTRSDAHRDSPAYSHGLNHQLTTSFPQVSTSTLTMSEARTARPRRATTSISSCS